MKPSSPFQAGVFRLACLFLLFAATSRADEGPLPVPLRSTIEAEDTAAVGQLIRLRATGEATNIEWYIVPRTEDFQAVGDRAFLSARGPGQFTVILDIETDGLHRQVTHVVVIGDQPDTPSSNITAAQVRTWLELVPEKVRTVPADNPVTGEKMTRQEAVGQTFSDIATAATPLGSIRATNVMLTTGLAAAFGPEAAGWRAFADRVDAALADAEKRGITATEYGKVLAVIGGALR